MLYLFHVCALMQLCDKLQMLRIIVTTRRFVDIAHSSSFVTNFPKQRQSTLLEVGSWDQFQFLPTPRRKISQLCPTDSQNYLATDFQIFADASKKNSPSLSNRRLKITQPTNFPNSRKHLEENKLIFQERREILVSEIPKFITNSKF